MCFLATGCLDYQFLLVMNGNIAGAYTFAFFATVTLNNLVENGILELRDNKDQFYFIVMIGAAIVGGLLLWWMWKVGFVIVGALLGFVTATLLLQLQFLQGLVRSDIARFIVIIIFAIGFAVLTLKLQDPIMIVGTSIIGAYATFLGVDYFARTGFGGFIYNAIYRYEFDGIDGRAWGMVAGFISLSVVGLVIQLQFARRTKK